MENKAASIVMVDDDPVDAFAIRRAFEHNARPFEFQHFSNGRDFLDFMESLLVLEDQGENWPSVVLLDINMPIMDGYEVVSRIREQPDFIGVPVVMLSTSEADDHIRRSYLLGANSHIVKPNSLAGLTNFSNTLLDYWADLVSVPHRLNT